MEQRDIWALTFYRYFKIKELYFECEETDPELKTNLQPLNEFRAALDHIMKMMWALYTDENPDEVLKQSEKLLSHLDRSFYDVCDMLSINYRNKINTCLEGFDADIILKALPNYYSQIKPEVEEISLRVITYRSKKGMNPGGTGNYEEYEADVKKLKEHYSAISKVLPTMTEFKAQKLQREAQAKKEKRRTEVRSYVIGGVIGAVGSAIVAIILHFVGI